MSWEETEKKLSLREKQLEKELGPFFESRKDWEEIILLIDKVNHVDTLSKFARFEYEKEK